MKDNIKKHLKHCYDVSFDWFDKDTFERNWKDPRGGPLLKHEEFCTIVKPVTEIESIIRRIYPSVRNLKITIHKPISPGEF